MNMNLKKSFAVLSVMLLAGASSAFAAPKAKKATETASAPAQYQAQSSNSGGASGWEVGAQLGPSIGLATGGGTSFMFGARGGYRVMPNLSAGLSLLFGSTSLVSTTDILAEGNYFFMGNDGLYGTVKMGFAISSVSILGVSASSTNFAFGPGVGYAYPIADKMTLGGEATFLIVSGASALNILAQFNYSI